jgi:hypothetical protein
MGVRESGVENSAWLLVTMAGENYIIKCFIICILHHVTWEITQSIFLSCHTIDGMLIIQFLPYLKVH